MIRYVTTSAWWRRALAGEPVAIKDGEPQPGYYRTKLIKNGPWVPARVWIEREVGDDGEQVNPDTFKCLIGANEADALDRWVWLSAYPISLADYKQLRELNAPVTSTLATMPPLF